MNLAKFLDLANIVIHSCAVKVVRLLHLVFSSQNASKDYSNELEFLFKYSTDAVYRLRYDDMKYEYVSPNITKLLGFEADEMMGMSFRSLIYQVKMVTDMRAISSYKELEEKRKSGDIGKWQADYLVRTKDGRRVWVSDVSYPWYDEKGELIGSIGYLRDINDRVIAEEKIKDEIHNLSKYDQLTKLYNRNEFFSTIEKELKRIKRSKNEFSILVIDIDHFKKVNDSYGHQVGDKVIEDVAKIIKQSIRETDLAARMGGEEFAIFLPDTPARGAYWVAERISSAVAKYSFPTMIDGYESLVGCTVSVGVSSARPDGAADAAALYKMADLQLYIAKNTGRNQIAMEEMGYLVH